MHWRVLTLTLLGACLAVFLCSMPMEAGDEPPGRNPRTTPGIPTDPPVPGLDPTSEVSRAVGQLTRIYTYEELLEGVYVGSELCLACHPAFETWRGTKHARILRRPDPDFSLMPGQGVVADYDRNGVDDFMQGLNFNQIPSAFDRFKPNAPVLGFANGQYTITIGELTMPVVATNGGNGVWKQRYLVRIPVTGTSDGLTRSNYVSPLQYNEASGRWATYRTDAWYDGSNLPRYGAGVSVETVASQNHRDFSQRCIGCHTTGTRELKRSATGEWLFTPYQALLFDPNAPTTLDYDHDGNPDLVNIGCESCHGFGSRHILGGGDPAEIVNPSELSTEAANEVCGQCHARVESVPRGVFDWPILDDSKTPFVPGQGEDLEDYFTDNSARWPDGIHASLNHQQYLDFLESPKPGFQFHPVKCAECHDPHGETTNPRLIRDVIVDDGLAIPTRVEDNTLCLACHASHGPFEELTPEEIASFGQHEAEVEEVLETHANHPYGPTRLMGLDRCVECHMPKVAVSAVPYDIRSHVFDAIPPEQTLRFQEQGGMPSSCAVSCHSRKVNVFGLGIDPGIGSWTQSFDRTTARILEKYFGPGGIWWDTTDTDSATFENLLMSTHPEDAEPAPSPEEAGD